MTRKGLSAIITLLALVSVQTPMRAYTLEYRDNAGVVTGRWLTKPIIISFSASLNSPPPNIKAGSDVIGAAQKNEEHLFAIQTEGAIRRQCALGDHRDINERAERGRHADLRCATEKLAASESRRHAPDISCSRTKNLLLAALMRNCGASRRSA